MMTTEELKEFCSREDSKYKLSTPHLFVLDGKPYSYAADGHRMVIVNGKREGLDLYPDLKISKYLIEPQGVEVNCADLKAFLECDKPLLIPCPHCAKQSCTCPECGLKHARKPLCAFCEGELVEDVRYGWLGIMLLNRALVAGPMRTCADETVKVYITGEEECFHIFASDRHIVCMPMRESGGQKNAPKFLV